MAGQAGVQSRILFDTATPFDSSSLWFEFLSESIVQEKVIVNNAGIRGTRAHASERNRNGNERVSGSIEFEVSRILFDNILPAALGAAESSNVFNVAESLPSHYWLIDKGGDIVLISEAMVNTLTITGNQSEIVRCTLAIEAESATWGQSWPETGPTPDTSRPYFFSDLGSVSIESSNRKIMSFEITVDNALSADQWANQLTRDGLLFPTDRIVNVNLTIPFTTDNKDLIGHSVAGEAISLVLTNADEASSVLTIALGRVSFNVGQPVVGAKGQLVLPLTGQSRALGHAGATAKDIAITNAHAT